MKTIFLILILSTLIFAADGDTLITTFDLPAVTANNDSLLQWFVDVLSSDSTDTTTRKLTYSVLLELMKNDTSFSEQSFTAAFNARLDSFLTLATTSLDTNNLVEARRDEWRRFARGDSSFNPFSINGTPYNWKTYHDLYVNSGSARVDSILYIGKHFRGTDFYTLGGKRFFLKDTVKATSYQYTYPGPLGPYEYSGSWTLGAVHQILNPADAAHDMSGKAFVISETASPDAAYPIITMTALSAGTENYSQAGVTQINNIYSSANNYGPITNMKGAWYNVQNADSVSGFAYGGQYSVTNLIDTDNGNTFYPYIESAAGVRIKVDNVNYYNDGNKVAIMNNANGGYFWINNQSSGDSAIINNAKGLDFVFQNQGANAYAKDVTMLNIQTPVNTGRVDSLVGLKINEQTAGDMGGSWAAYIEGPKSYIEDLRTDTLTVSDSISTDKLHITDIATYDSDRDITDLYHLTDKRYVDEAVTALGARYYMIDDVSGEADYKSCSTTASTGGEQSVSGEDLANDDYVQGWIAPNTNEPDKLLLGVYNWRIYAEKTGGTKTLRLYWKLVERKNDDSEVVIATSVVSNEVVSGKNSYIIPLNLATDYDIASDSYVVGKIYADVSGGGSAPDITLYYEGSSHSHWQIPVNTEILDNLYVKKAGDTMTGTLNLPSDGLAVGDSIITESDIAAWDAAADSMDQDVRSTASPTFKNLTADTLFVAGAANTFAYNNGAKLVSSSMMTQQSNYIQTESSSSSSDISRNYGAYTQRYTTGGTLGDYDYIKHDSNNRGMWWTIYRYNAAGGKTPSNSAFWVLQTLGQQTSAMPYFHKIKVGISGDADNGDGYVDFGVAYSGVMQHPLYIYGYKLKISVNTGFATDLPDSGRVVIDDDNPWALVLGDKASTPWSAIRVGDASFTTSSDSTKKRDIRRKIAKGDTTILSRLLDMPEADWYWDGAKVKREKFDPERHWHGEVEWDSLSVTKQDSIRSAWIARREARIAKLAGRKRFGPMAQDVANALGPEAGDGESINWDRVNSEYRRAVQELIVIVRKQQEQIDDLKKRVAKLEKKR